VLLGKLTPATIFPLFLVFTLLVVGPKGWFVVVYFLLTEVIEAGMLGSYSGRLFTRVYFIGWCIFVGRTLVVGVVGVAMCLLISCTFVGVIWLYEFHMFECMRLRLLVC